MQEIWLNGTCYTHSEILNQTPDPDKLTETEYTTLQFCQQWLQGQTVFPITTSGSTGQPKTMTLTREQMALSTHLTGKAVGLNPGDTALACLSPTYIAGRMMLVRALELDLRLVVVEPGRNPLASPHLAQFDKIDLAALVPLQLHEIIETGGTGLARLNQMKAVLVGGAPVSIALENALAEIKAPVYQTFGMTETVSHIALRRLNGPEKSHAYHVLPEVEIACDKRGCLLIKSALAPGETLVTNDRVELLSPTSFVWLGRSDNVINSGGIKVQAERVERALAVCLAEFGEVVNDADRFFVAGLPDSELGEKVVVVFERQLPESVSVEQLRKALAKHLHKYEIPKSLFFLPKFARTPTGKIQRRATLAGLQTEAV